MFTWAAAGLAQETDFSPFARFGLGTAQGTLTPALVSMGGVTSVSTGHMSVNADQPASSAGLVHPTFQGSLNLQGIRLTEGDRSTQTTTGGPGSFGLVVKRARRPRAFHLGLTPMTSKAFNVVRSVTDTTLGDITESYDGQGGLARAYVGFSHGWRGRQWTSAGSSDSVLVNTWDWMPGFKPTTGLETPFKAPCWTLKMSRSATCGPPSLRGIAPRGLFWERKATKCCASSTMSPKIFKAAGCSNWAALGAPEEHSTPTFLGWCNPQWS